MRKIFLITAVAALMSSCSLYKSYQRPDVSTDGLYRDEPKGQQDTTSIGNLSWREMFTDVRLQRLIEQGLENNTDLRIARLRVDQAEISLRSARLAYVPSLGVNGQGTISSFDSQKAGSSYQVGLSASWEVDIFGKLTNAKRGAKAAVEQSDAYRQAVQTQLVAAIANSYYSLLMLDEQLIVNRQTLQNWQQNIVTMRALKEAGLTDEAAIAQSEASALSVEASILVIGRQIGELENSLSTLLGTTPQAIERNTLIEQHFPAELSVGVPLQMLSNRPDVRASEFSLAQAFYATNEARSAFYPSITLSGSAGWTNSAGSFIANPAKLLLSTVGSLVQPIFNKGLNKARLDIAKSQQEEALLSFQQSLLNAGAEVNDALVQWQVARKKIDVDLRQIDFLEQAVKNTNLLMEHSNRTYLEVLVAEQSLLRARITHISDKFDEIQGVINLYHSLGGGRF